MKDAYSYDSEGVEKTIGELKQKRSNYEEKIAELVDLAKEISMSPAWRDVSVKSEFMNTYNVYLTIYKDTYLMMERYEKYLASKSKLAQQIEQNYMR